MVTSRKTPGATDYTQRIIIILQLSNLSLLLYFKFLPCNLLHD